MKITRCFLTLILLGWIIVTLSGCWDVSPIEDRALNLLIGIDRKDGKYRFLTQIPTLSGLVQTQHPGTDKNREIQKISIAEAPSLVETIQHIEDENYRAFVIGTVKSILLSESVAQKDSLKIITSFIRHPMVSSQTLLFTTTSNIEELIRLSPPYSIQPGLMLVRQQKSALKMARSFPVEAWEFVSRIDNGFPDAYMPIISIDKKDKNYLLEGMKVFKRGEMIGELNPEETYIFGILTGNAQRAFKIVHLKDQVIGIHDVSHQTKIKYKPTKEGRPTFLVTTKAEGTLLEVSPGLKMDPNTLKTIKISIENHLKKDITKVLQKLRRLASDPIGFSNQLKIAGVKNWRQIYRRSSFQVNVEFIYKNDPPAR